MHPFWSNTGTTLLGAAPFQPCEMYSTTFCSPLSLPTTTSSSLAGSLAWYLAQYGSLDMSMPFI